MKKLHLIIVLFNLMTYSQKHNYISYTKSYLDNKTLFNSVKDNFNVSYTLPKGINVKSNFLYTKNSFLNEYNLNQKEIGQLYSFDFEASKKINLSASWSINSYLKPQFRSNVSSLFKGENFLLNASVSVDKEIKAIHSTMHLALSYGTLLGKPSFYPEFEFLKKINNKNSFGIGFPSSFYRFDFNDKETFKFQATYESYFTRFKNNSLAKTVSSERFFYNDAFYKNLNFGFGYEHKFINDSILDVTLGKNSNNKLEILDSSNTKTVFEYNNSFTISIGFKYNLNFK
jgi:hypothetical protein